MKEPKAPARKPTATKAGAKPAAPRSQGPAAKGGAQRLRRKMRGATAEKKKIRKADVTGPIDRESARVLRIARELGEERASKPLEGGWSVRDVVAHCVYWQGMLARMMGAHLPPPSWIPRWQSEEQLGTDELNRLTVEHYRTFPYETLVSDFRFTADLVKRIVDAMKEENLLLEAGKPWGKGTKVHEAIAGETYGHWKEHLDAIEVAVAAAPEGGARRATAEQKEAGG